MSNTEYEPGDRVRVLVGGPHENRGRIATVGRIQDNGLGGKLIVIYFGDQDEDEWVYEAHELERNPVLRDTDTHSF